MEGLGAKQSSEVLMEPSNTWDFSAKNISMMCQKKLMVEQQEVVGKCEYLARQGQQGFVVESKKHLYAWSSAWRVQARAPSSST